ncbi:MAG: glycoside hydrolase family 13 protein [Defluviitaleaceae bacterium]|nr:glycoside hydrolase family 13 protein [Defluviitaleaceae bacterium]MCL2262587.1 glycoside hydrolase family 13 protein [Defluviitaleaceae bacterium]
MSFNKVAVFSDETKQFIKPYDPKAGDTVRFCLRVAKGDKCLVSLHIAPVNGIGGPGYPMKKTESDELFDYYTVSIQVYGTPIRYYYSVRAEGHLHYYNKQGIRDWLDSHYNFRLVPGLNVPEWAKGAVMYQIFVDRFYNGDKSNDVMNHEYAYLGKTAMSLPWEQDISTGDFCNFYGGDIQGMIDKMSYFKELGIDVIYLNPIFVSPSSHKYDTQDYDYIDPHFGVIVEDGGDNLRFEKVDNKHATRYKKRTTSKKNLEASNKLFAKFVSLAHKNGIKVILDGVFNHCGSFNKWLDYAGLYHGTGEPEGAYHSKDSPYNSYFLWHGGTWPKNDCYDGWWANSNHPKLNFETSQELFDHIIRIAKKWVSPPYNIDGWRLDVAADLGQSPEMNHKFWRAFHDAVKEANPKAIILAEHYGDPSSWLNGCEWDTIMNYDAFMEPITWFLTGVSKHSEESHPHLRGDALAFEGAMRHHMSLLNVHALHSAMNQLSNHDHSRFLTRTSSNTGRHHSVGSRAAERGINKNILMEAVIFQMTWPGAPTIYYGDEAGLAGWTDPDNRRPFPWGKEDLVLIDLHKKMIALRKEFSALREGSVEFIWTNHGFLSYGRWDKSAKIVVAINNNPKPLDVTLPVWKIGISDGELTERMQTGGNTFRQTAKRYPVSNGELKITVPILGTVVLVQS